MAAGWGCLCLFVLFLFGLFGFGLGCTSVSDCSTGNPCLSNPACNASSQCTYTYPIISCDDGDGNTKNDICNNGVCKGTCILNYNGTCVSSCPSGYAVDGSTCSKLYPACGSSCLTCEVTTNRTCARCTPDKYLDGGVCSDSCTVKKADGTDSYNIKISPFGKVCTEYHPSSSSSLSKTVLLGIIIGACALGLIIIGVLIYVGCFGCCKKMREKVRMRQESAEMSDLTNVNNAEEGKGPIASPPVVKPIAWGEDIEDPTKWQQTMRRPESSTDWQKTLRRDTKKIKMLELEMAENDTEETTVDSVPMSKREAQEFHDKLKELKKDKNAFFLIMDEMKRRQAMKSDAASKAKYDQIISDLRRVIKMFKIRKDETTLPLDGLQLLAWAEKTLHSYLNKQASLR